MKSTFRLIVAAAFSMIIPAMTMAQCPEQLLWTNGSSLWAYRAVDCSGDYCRTATDKVLYYGSEVKATGCVKDGDACKCRAEAKPISAVAAIEPDLAIQNRGCRNLDTFVVKIGEDYIQCVEFRYVPDQGKVDDFGQAIARNMRLCVKLSGKPEKGESNLLVDDNAKVDGNAVVRTLGDTMVSYPMMAAGEQTLEALVTREAPKPTTVSTEKEQEKPGPDDDDAGDTENNAGDADEDAGDTDEDAGDADEDAGDADEEAGDEEAGDEDAGDEDADEDADEDDGSTI